ncbi:Crp/Fnr family transcriptional regulator [Sabulicella rubraurantiaca]|uniref:Crp/Fnr family transcriptional regulator n=1 Tax=Sabulicella rubraurantiaca TaxID=2811429 RepID=UPI001A959149|nr:helix-turn-helix domain-containing protein [Sabulicella rubraurantiaca]
MRILESPTSAQSRRRARRHPEAATIFVEGDGNAESLRVLAGIVRLVRHTEDGRRCVLDFRFPGQVFGRSADDHLLTAEAATDCLIESVEDAEERGELEADTSLLDRVTCLAVRLACCSATERVAQFLLEVHERLAADSVFTLPLSRQDVADHLGIRSETLCRCLAHLAREGMIATRSGQVVEIHDPAALHAAAHEGRRRACRSGGAGADIGQ